MEILGRLSVYFVKNTCAQEHNFSIVVLMIYRISFIYMLQNFNFNINLSQELIIDLDISEGDFSNIICFHGVGLMAIFFLHFLIYIYEDYFFYIVDRSRTSSM